MRISDWSSDVCSSDLRNAGDLGAELELDSLLLEDLVRFLADLSVETGQDLIEELDARHLGTKPPPHATEFEPDHPAADDDHMLGHLGQFERAGEIGSASRRDRVGQKAKI